VCLSIGLSVSKSNRRVIENYDRLDGVLLLREVGEVTLESPELVAEETMANGATELYVAFK